MKRSASGDFSGAQRGLLSSPGSSSSSGTCTRRAYDGYIRARKGVEAESDGALSSSISRTVETFEQSRSRQPAGTGQLFTGIARANAGGLCFIFGRAWLQYSSLRLQVRVN